MAGSWTVPSSSSNPPAATAPTTTMVAVTNPRIAQEVRLMLLASDDGALPRIRATSPIQPTRSVLREADVSRSRHPIPVSLL